MKKIMLAICQLGGGGAERVVSIWSRKLSEVGYDVSVLVYGRTENEYEISPDVKIFSVVPDYKDFTKFSYFERIKKMRKILKAYKPDVVISFLPRMQICCNLASVGLKHKRIETVRNNPWMVYRGKKLDTILYRYIFNRANGIMVQTAEQTEFFSKRNQAKCVVIPNPVSDRYLTVWKKHPSNRVRYFAAAGRLTPQKNYPLMIKAFAAAHKQYLEIELKIYGQSMGAYDAELKKMVRDERASDFITFCGFSRNIASELEEADAFLMTSDYEGMPNALVEAMALGLVCISTDCRTGPKDMITDIVDGFLAETGSMESVVNCICRAAELTSNEIREIGQRARSKILNLCSDVKSTDALINAIETI